MSDPVERENDLLFSEAFAFGINLSAEQIRLLGLHIDELIAWNRKFNLTGLTARKRIIIELVLDSLIAAPFLPENGYLLDVGSGAGFPGIPIKISKPRLNVHLLEANAKKVNFLKHIIRSLQLKGVKTIRGRVETGGGLKPDGYQIVTARAVADLDGTLRWCAPRLASGGILVNFLGSRADRSLEASSAILEDYNLQSHKITPYVLPYKEKERHLLIFKKAAS